MTDMQRYEGPSIPRDQGSYVLASDAEAAIAAAEKRGFGSGLVKSLTIADCYESGQRDMLAKCIAAVKEVRNELAHPDWVRLTARDGAQESVNELKRIQRALQEKP